MQSFPIDAGFIGLDTYTAGESLGTGYCTALDNLQVEGSSSGARGYLVPRPGKQGILTAALGSAVYALTSFVDANGVSKLLFTSNGRLYVMNPTDAAATEITALGGGSMGLNSATTRFKQVGTRIFIVDGVGALKWTDLTLGRTYSGLNQPAQPTATLTSSSVPSGTGMGAKTWLQNFYTPATELVTEPNPPGGSGWTLNGSASGSASQNGDGGVWIDQNGDGCTSDPILVPTMTPATPMAATSYAKLFKIAFDICGGTSNPTTIDDHDTTLIVYNNVDGALIHETGRKTFRDVPSGSQGQRIEHLFDFSDVASEILAVRIFFNQYRDRHFKGVVINHVSLMVPEQKFQLSTVSGDLQVARGSLYMVDNVLKAQGRELATDLTAANWGSIDRLVIKLNTAGITDTTAIRLQLWLQQTGATTRYYSNDLDFSLGSGQAFVDISTIPVAIRTSFRYLGIAFLSDLPMPDSNGASPGTPVLTIGSLVTPGNLSIGLAPYQYLTVEEDGSNDVTYLVDVIESPGSLPTPALETTQTQAQALITMPVAYTNGAATYRKVYRRGGAFRDAFYRLVSMLPSGQATFAAGAAPNIGTAPYYAQASNPYLSYSNPGGGAAVVLTDNTPDSYLETAEVYIPGRVSPPVGASCIASHGGRIALGVGNELFISWPVTGSAVYFSLIDNPNDPSFLSEGFHDWVGGKNGDTIQDIIPLAGRLTILKKIKSPWILLGSDPSDWDLVEYTGQDGQGMAAPFSGIVFDNKVFYLSPEGLVSFDGVRYQDASQRLVPVLNPDQIDNAALNPAAYNKSFTFTWRTFFFLVAPRAAGDTQPQIAYRLNKTTNEWDGTWLQMNVTSAASVPHPSQSNDLFVAGYDGQIYKMTGTADKALPASSGSAIACLVTGRKYGVAVSPQAEYAGQGAIMYFSRKVAQRVIVGVVAGTSSLTFTVGVVGDTPALADSKTYTVPAGSGPRKPLKVNSRVRGRAFRLSVAWSSTTRPKLNGLGLQLSVAAQSGLPV